MFNSVLFVLDDEGIFFPEKVCRGVQQFSEVSVFAVFVQDLRVFDQCHLFKILLFD